MAKNHLYLIPGFFGFANFGELKYFAHVRAELEKQLPADRVEIHYVPTRPTATIELRTERLLEVIEATSEPGSAIHLVGHSSGGLDGRLLASSAASGAPDERRERVVPRLRSLVTLATPHRGVPQVSFLVGELGPPVLRLLSLSTIHLLRLGSIPLPLWLSLVRLLTQFGGKEEPLVRLFKQLDEQLLSDFDDERQGELRTFLEETNNDQGLVQQLGHAPMSAFDAAHPPMSHVRTASVVARCRPPSWSATLEVGLSPTGQASYGVFRALHALAGRMPQDHTPTLSPEQASALNRAYGDLPTTQDNDAVVPTLSQVFGEVIHATWADHLDVIGHFGGDASHAKHVEWINTQSGFAEAQFEELWSTVSSFISGSLG